MKHSFSQTSTSRRKREHVDIVLNRDVSFREKSAGFEQWEFEHNALPEINFADVDSRTIFLGKQLTMPLMVSCMTGGYRDARSINSQIAEVCEEFNIAMGVGSQRQALEDSSYHKSFSIVRKVAPTIPIIGNIGAAEIAHLKSADSIQRLVEMIGADGFAVHLNPLQELLQPEGNPNFRGVANGIELLVKHLSVPLIVKEIGAGISASVARRLLEIGVNIIDIAGAGGTSWAGVELTRRKNGATSGAFWDWGIPTAVAVKEVAALRTDYPDLIIIASGGVADGLHIGKSIALGADMAAVARPVLQALHKGRKRGVKNLFERWLNELRKVMFLVGAEDLTQLRKVALRPRWISKRAWT